MNKVYVAWSIMLITLAIGLSGCFSSDVHRLPTESRQISSNTLNLKEHWRKTQIRIKGFSYDNLHLWVISGRVVYVQGSSNGPVDQLQVLDAASGDLLWRLPEERMGIGQVTVDTKRVYFMADFIIRAHELNDGRRLWQSQEMPPHRTYSLWSNGEKVYAGDLTKGVTYHFDANTGSPLDSDLSATSDGFVLSAQFPQFDLHISDNALQAVDRATYKSLWTTNVTSMGSSWRVPVLVEDVLLVGFWDRVIAIDSRTGQVIWRNQDIPFASNFAVMNGYLYALDYNARLVKLDIKTGQEKGYIQFTPARTNVSEKSYSVAADRQMLFVSFSDSQELIALGP